MQKKQGKTKTKDKAGRMKRYAAVLLCASAVFLGTYSGKVCAFEAYTLKAGTSEAQQTEAVADFVRSYYEAHTPEGLDSLGEMMDGDSRLYVAKQQALMELGFLRFENIEVSVYPMKEEDFWLVGVAYEMIIDSISDALPGWNTVLVQKEENGDLKILEDVPRELREEIVQITTEEEFAQAVMEQDLRFKEILQEKREIITQLDEIQRQMTVRAALILEGEDDAGGSKEAVNDLYIVQKGDCLWNIAEKWLGDGMLWRELYRANQSVIGGEPDLILPGMQSDLKF